MTAVEWLHQFDPAASRQDIHGLLGQMLFSGEEGLKPTEALSGGETARMLFCRIMLQKPNVLVLDEPTNHLDLESINALNVALQKFEGTVLLVTHDQDVMEEVGTRVWHFERGGDSRLQGHLRGVHRLGRVSRCHLVMCSRSFSFSQNDSMRSVSGISRWLNLKVKALLYGLGIVNRHLNFHRAEVDAAKAFGHAHRVTVGMSEGIQPAAVLETRRLDDQGVAVPPAD